MNNLAIVVRSKHKGNRKSDTVPDLVDYWPRSNEMGKFILELLSLKICYSWTFKKHEIVRKPIANRIKVNTLPTKYIKDVKSTETWQEKFNIHIQIYFKKRKSYQKMRKPSK